MVAVAEEVHGLALADGALGRLDPLAPAGAGPQAPEEAERAVLGVGAVVLAHNGLDGLGGLVGVVEGDGADVVVQHVGLDDAVQQLAADEAELAVDGGRGAAHVVPALGGIVWDGRVGVLQVRDSDCFRQGSAEPQKNVRGVGGGRTEPVVHPQIRDEVPHEHVGEAVGAAEHGQDGDGDGQAQVAEEDELGILGLEERAGRAEVVDAGSEAVLHALAAALGLALVVVVARDVAEEVHGPAEQLLGERVDDGGDGRLLGQLVQLVGQAADAAGELVARLGHEDHVALHVARGLVVLAVRDLPREVGDQEGRVADEARGVVEHLGGREGLVAALVGQHPQAGAEEALDHGVQGPEGGAGGRPGDVIGGDEVVEEGKGEGQAGDVTGDVGQAAQAGALEAVLGDGIADVVDRVVGQLELVAVGVEQLAVGCLGIVERGHGRERGGRGRLARSVSGGALGGGGGRVGVHGGSGPAQGVTLGAGGGGGGGGHGGGEVVMLNSRGDGEDSLGEVSRLTMDDKQW